MADARLKILVDEIRKNHAEVLASGTTFGRKLLAPMLEKCISDALVTMATSGDEEAD